MRIDGVEKLRNLLQTLAFCLAVASLHYAFAPEKPYGPFAAYSLAIGVSIWTLVDFGRHLLPSARDSGWPTGWTGVALVVAGIAGGWIVGNYLGEQVSRALDLFPPGHQSHREADLRSGLLITLVAGTVGSYWFYSRSRSDYLERRMHEVQRHANEARLKLLETQLEPHMLFNTLANLRALIGVDPAAAQQMLDHMIAYLRATLDASRAATHPLQAEFDRVQDYLELMAIRMGPRLAYTLDLPQELAPVPVPALLLQPLVENSIQHGLEPKVGGGRIEVHARREDARLVIEVRDTGVGAAASTRAGRGFGLAQVRERLAALHGTLASLEFRRDAAGAHARIVLPLACQ